MEINTALLLLQVVILFRAAMDIPAGVEILHDYGDGYRGKGLPDCVEGCIQCARPTRVSANLT